MITQNEYELLKEYRRLGYKWIARDKNGYLYTYYREPKRIIFCWEDTELDCTEWSLNDDSFLCIKWEDEEPTKINDLIRDYEAHQVLKQEPKKAVIPEGYEVLSDEWLAEHSEFADGIGEFYIYETVGNMEKLLIPKHVKVTIPQFVADWIDEIKDKNCVHALEILFDTASMPTKVYYWLKQDSKNWDIMARAWLDGYEVEKEKLYTVRLANGSCLYRYVSVGIDWIKGPSDYRNDKDFQLTQSEIESVDPILMQIAKEVE